MSSKEYYQSVLKHMDSYRRNFLGVTSMGTYGIPEKRYGHILPVTKGEIPILNFLPSINIQDKIIQDMHYHTYSHHLNSSQIMCVNFFFPIINTDILLSIISEITGISTSSNTMIKEATFEKIVNGEEKTNFDFYVELTTGEKIYFEIKYTEQSFGGDCFKAGKLKDKYILKYENIYSEFSKDSLIQVDDKEEFFRNYQINRNLSYIKSKSDYVVFLIPFKSNNLYREVSSVVSTYNISNQVRIVDWTRICNIALTNSKDTIYYQHFKLFENKYIL